MTTSEEALKSARAALEKADTAREGAEGQRDKVRDIRAQSAEALSRLRAEAGALEDVLAHDAETEAADWTPMIDEIEVTQGYEAALGAALGEDLDAPMDSRAPRHWNMSDTPADDPALPAGCPRPQRIRQQVRSAWPTPRPDCVVDNAETGARLAGSLKPGQRLVDRDGQLWRWDGYVASGDARSSASTRLRQRNRLVELGDRIAAAETAFERIDTDFTTAKQNADTALEAARAARARLDSADNAASQARRSHANLSSEFAARIARHESLTETLARIEGEVAEVETRLADTRTRRTAIGDLDEIRSTTEGMRGQLSEARNALSAAQSEHDRLVREAEERHRRIAALAAEEISWQARHTGAGERIGELETREAQARSESQALSAKPAEIEALRFGS